MTIKVDFYVLAANKQQSLLFAANLLEKYYQQKKSVYVHTASQQDASHLDQFLWTYRDDSFLPHQLQSTATKYAAPIEIGFKEDEATIKNNKQVLLNLTNTVPRFFLQFESLIEIVFDEPTVQQLARERFKEYRSLGCELITHKPKVIE